MITKMYLHSSKDTNYDKAEELGLSEEATKVFAYALYEVCFTVDINEQTGETKILAVDGKELK